MNSKKNDQDQQNVLPDVAVSGVDNSRRKFNKAGLIAPVLLTLSSKPVWAVQCSPSILASGGLSNPCTNPPNGFTAAQLLNADAWPSPLTQSTTFDSVFGTTPTNNFSLFGANATLSQVLNGLPLYISSGNLQTQFNCTIGGSPTTTIALLQTDLTAYAVQSIVSALNKLYFPNYAYAGVGTFYSAISVSLSNQVTCDIRAASIATVTAALQNLTT